MPNDFAGRHTEHTYAIMHAMRRARRRYDPLSLCGNCRRRPRRTLEADLVC